MTLSKEQIENLYAFTRKHFVEYYDLQTELVDHMANDIEVILEKDSSLNFEQAREKAFKKFRRLVRFKDSIICMVIINLAIYYLPLLLSFRVTESFLLSLSLPRSKRKRE